MSTDSSWNSLGLEIVNSIDVNQTSLEQLKEYFQTGERRVNVVSVIASNATEIIQETMEVHSSHANSFQPNQTVRQYAACIRDLDYFLRGVIYAILTSDLSVLDEQVLNGLAEVYVALNISIDLTVEYIRTMQKITARIVEPEDSQMVMNNFEYLCSQLIESNQSTLYNNLISNQFSEDRQSWEPKNYHEWLNQDKLAQQIQKNSIENIISLEDSAEGFFQALNHLPYGLRKQVWREREIMAALYQQMSVWEKIPGFVSVGVGRRDVNGKNRLVGIINFIYGTPLELMHHRVDIPALIKVDSSITGFNNTEKDIPIVIEVSDFPVYQSSQTRLDTISSIATTELVIQSGDKISSRGENGFYGPRVTLTTFVIPQGDSSHLNSISPYLLTVRHGFLEHTDINTCEIKVNTKIGEVVDNTENSRQKNLMEKLDIALIKLSADQEYILKPHLRWVDEYPKKPVPIVSGMPVQMFGGTSKHTLGFIDESMIIYPGPNQSIVPNFSVTVSSQARAISFSSRH